MFRSVFRGVSPSLACVLVAAVTACGGSGSASSGDDSGAVTPADDAGPGDLDATSPDAPIGTDASARDAAAPPPGSPPPATSAIQIIVEPNGKDAQELVAAIDAATTSVHMTMYLLSSTAVIDSLIAQHQKGHEVKVLLNKTFPMNQGSNSQSFSQLQSAGVDVQWAPSGFTLTHEKCVILDGKTAWIMTMNTTQSSPTSNREYLAVDTDAADVAEAEAIFAADFANQAYAPPGGSKLVVSNNNSRAKLVQLIGAAKTNVDSEVEELSDDGIVAALESAADRGARVRVTLPTGATVPQLAALKQHGVQLVATGSPYIHAKAFVVDGTYAYVGSENFTSGSLSGNRELGVITNAAAEVAKVQTTTAQDFANGTAL